MQEKKSIDLNNLFKKFDTMKHNFEGKKWRSVAKYFNELMVRIAEISFISEIDATYNSDVDLHVLARNTLEIGVEWCAVTGDVNGFERYQAMLWSYYFDFAVDLPESDKKYEIIGLNLMQLLSKNEAVTFHTELESLDSEVVLNNRYISFVVKLEQAIQTGDYKTAMKYGMQYPSPSYKIFADHLVNTNRDEIAKGIEVAYDKISVDGCKALILENFERTGVPKSKDSWRVNKVACKWNIDHQNVVQFPNTANEKPTGENIVDTSKELAIMAIGYAKENEKIV